MFSKTLFMSECRDLLIQKNSRKQKNIRNRREVKKIRSGYKIKTVPIFINCVERMACREKVKYRHKLLGTRRFMCLLYTTPPGLAFRASWFQCVIFFFFLRPHLDKTVFHSIFHSWKCQSCPRSSDFNISLSIAGNPNLMVKYGHSYQIQIHGPTNCGGTCSDLGAAKWGLGGLVIPESSDGLTYSVCRLGRQFSN